MGLGAAPKEFCRRGDRIWWQPLLLLLPGPNCPLAHLSCTQLCPLLTFLPIRKCLPAGGELPVHCSHSSCHQRGSQAPRSTNLPTSAAHPAATAVYLTACLQWPLPNQCIRKWYCPGSGLCCPRDSATNSLS